MLCGLEEVGFHRPFMRNSEVYDRSILRNVVFDCDYDLVNLNLDRFTILPQAASSYGREPVFEFSGLPVVELTRLVRVEVWLTITQSNSQLSILSRYLNFNWTALLSLTPSLSTYYTPVDLYDTKVALLGSNQMHFSTHFQVPGISALKQMSESNSFFCDKGFYLLLGLHGRYPEMAASIQPMSIPFEILCSAEGLTFDFADLHLGNNFNDGCYTSTSDSTYQETQCTQYRSLSSEKLETGLVFSGTIELKQHSSAPSALEVNAETLLVKANLAEPNSLLDINSGGVQLLAENVYVGKSIIKLVFMA